MRHDSVASLAGAIADRLGGEVSDKDLIASADLGSRRESADDRAGAICRWGINRDRSHSPLAMAETPSFAPMTTTTAAYLSVTQNFTRYQAMTAAEPAVKTATAYYEANIGKVTSIQDFVGNYRLLSYALDAYGLGDQINAKALITKVLEGGVSNPKSLANTLSDSRWKAFAAAFDFAGQGGASSVSSTSAVKTTTADYVEQQLESDQGAQDVGVQLALYFQRVAPTIPTNTGSSPIRTSWRWRRRSSVCRRRRAQPTSMHRRRRCRN